MHLTLAWDLLAPIRLMSNIPIPRKAISFVDEKYKKVIFAVLYNYSDIKLTLLDFVDPDEIVDNRLFSHDKGAFTVNAFCDIGISIFVVGLSTPFDRVIVDEILKVKRGGCDIMLIIVTDGDDLLQYSKVNSINYYSVINSADKVCVVKFKV